MRKFITGRNEYTVNIGLISDGTSTLGVIVAPALELIWRGDRWSLRRASAGQMSTAAARSHPRAPSSELIVMAAALISMRQRSTTSTDSPHLMHRLWRLGPTYNSARGGRPRHSHGGRGQRGRARRRSADLQHRRNCGFRHSWPGTVRRRDGRR